ncbi:MAG TPA: hypothetical protein VH044_18700 [Polyangiaceae bacterium]|nr:hypothetical protein [Polyangiaceae bacterium]
MRAAAVATWVVMACLVGPGVGSGGGSGEARADALSDLEKAHNAYVAHKYGDAEARLRALLDPGAGTLKDPDTIADARMYLGASLLAEGKKADAATVFEQLLRDKPDYQPDPLRVTLQATDALIDARSRLREELAATMAEKVRLAQEEKAKIEVERQKAAQRLAMLEKLASEETLTERHSRWLALIPFGVGQFQNGQTALGIGFLVVESLAVIGNVVSQVILLYNENQTNDAVRTGNATAAGYHARAQDAYVAGDLFAAGFAVAAIAGIVHAQLTFVPERIEVRQRPLPPVAKFSLTPLLAPLVSRAASGQAEGARGVILGVGGSF